MSQTITLILKGDASGLAKALGQASEATVKELGKVKSSTDQWKAFMADLRNVSKAGFLAIGAAATAATAGIVAGVRQSINAMDDLSKASARIGTTTQALSELRYAADLSGVANQTLEKGLISLINRQAEAARGNQQYAATFESLGVRITNADGSLRGTTELVEDLAERFSKLPEGPERAKLAFDAFGKAGTQLIPLLAGGKEGLAEMAAEAANLGLVIDSQAAKQAEAFNDNLSRLQLTFTGVFNTLAAEVLPWLVDLSDQFVQNVKDAGSVKTAVDTIRTGFQLIVTAGSLLVNTFQIIGKSIASLVKSVEILSTGVFKVLGDTVAGIGNYQDALLKFDFSGAAAAIKQGFANVTSGAADTITQLAEQQKGAFADIKQEIKDVTDAFAKLGKPTEQAAAGIEGSGNAAGRTAPRFQDLADDTNELAKRTSEAARASTDLQKLLNKQAGELGGPALQAAQKYRDGLVEIARVEAELIRLKTLDAAAIAQISFLRQAAFQNYQKDLVELSKEATKTAKAVQREFTDTERIGLGFFDSLLQAGSDFATRQIRSFSDLFDAFKSIAQRALSDIIYTYLRSKILVPIELGVQGGGGIAGGLASLFGGGAGGQGGIGSLFSGLGNLISGGIGNGAFGLGSALFNNFGGGLGAFGGGLATGGANILGSGFFGSLGTNLSGGFGSLFGGSFFAGLGQLASVLGPIAGIASLVDAVSGGRLFGTSYRPESAARQLSIGPDGATGFESITESRRRSLFRGTRRRTTVNELDDDAQDAIDNLFAQVQDAIRGAAAVLGTEAANLIGGTFRQEFDSKGNLKREWVEIAGRIYEEGQEAFSQRLVAENLIASVAQAFADAGTIAERWRSNAEDLLDGSQFLLAVATQMRQGFDLLGTGTLAPVVDLVEELQGANESLMETYTRLSTSTMLFEQALDLSGVTLDLSRESMVRFAADVAEAAGGVDQLQALLQGYENAYFSAQERAARALNRTRTSASTEFSDIGLNLADFTGEGGMAALRQMFEERLNSLGADAVVQWLQALNALTAVNIAQEAYNETVGATATAVEELVQLNQQALTNYAEFAQGIRGELDDLGGSDFQRQLRGIARSYGDQVTTLQRLAREAGLASASTDDLSNAFQLASQRAAQALAQLVQAGREQATQLYGSRLADIEALIAAETARASQPLSNFAGAVTEVARAASAATNLLLGDLSPLRDKEKLPLALQALRAGEIGAEEVLRIAQRVNGSGQDYNNIFAQVQEIVRAQQQASFSGGGGGGGGGGAAPNPVLAALQAEREQLLGEQNRLQRFGQAQTLAQTVADIAGATGESFETVFRDLVGDRASFADFARDLRLDSAEAVNAYLQTLQADRYDFASITEQLEQIFQAHLTGLRQIFNDQNYPGAIALDVEPGTSGKPVVGQPIPGITVESTSGTSPMAQQQATLDAQAASTARVAELLQQFLDRIVPAVESSALADGQQVEALRELATALREDGPAEPGPRNLRATTGGRDQYGRQR